MEITELIKTDDLQLSRKEADWFSKAIRHLSSSKASHTTIKYMTDGSVSVDLRGEANTDFLFSFSRTMKSFNDGTMAHLLTSSEPCADTIKAWCREMGYHYEGLLQDGLRWRISVYKPVKFRLFPSYDC